MILGYNIDGIKTDGIFRLTILIESEIEIERINNFLESVIGMRRYMATKDEVTLSFANLSTLKDFLHKFKHGDDYRRVISLLWMKKQLQTELPLSTGKKEKRTKL